jgi:hypothetical protein
VFLYERLFGLAMVCLGGILGNSGCLVVLHQAWAHARVQASPVAVMFATWSVLWGLYLAFAPRALLSQIDSSSSGPPIRFYVLAGTAGLAFLVGLTFKLYLSSLGYKTDWM